MGQGYPQGVTAGYPHRKTGMRGYASGVAGAATNEPFPWTVYTRPRSRNSFTARRAVSRATPYSSANRTSDGIGRSTASVPAAICAATRSATCT